MAGVCDWQFVPTLRVALGYVAKQLLVVDKTVELYFQFVADKRLV
ncbi:MULTISPECIES: hypothetical protein [unclassified Shewanella]|nr:MULTISPECIES: hypothetical protein [unclassified Shewanella]